MHRAVAKDLILGGSHVPDSLRFRHCKNGQFAIKDYTASTGGVCCEGGGVQGCREDLGLLVVRQRPCSASSEVTACIFPNSSHMQLKLLSQQHGSALTGATGPDAGMQCCR